MKRKLLFLLAALLTSVGMWAYTTSDLEAAGWTQVTSLPTPLSDYYFVFVDNGGNLMMDYGTGNHQESTSKTMYYRTNANPITTPTMVWILADNTAVSGTYSIKNLNEPTKYLQEEWRNNAEAPWFCHTSDNGGSAGIDRDWCAYNIVYADSKWTIQTYRVRAQAGSYVGPWSNSFVNDAEVAGNKSGSSIGYFQIYQIKRSTYLKLNPTASFIWNADFEESVTYEKSSTATVATNAATSFAIGAGWTQTTKGDWAMGTSVAYGSGATLNSVNAPSADPNGNDGVAVFFSAGHGNQVLFKQSANITLLPGKYTLRYKAYNQNSSATNLMSHFGFVSTDESIKVTATNESFTYQTWVEKAVNIEVEEAKEGYFQIGVAGVSGAGGSGANAKIFVDGITLEYEDYKATLRAVIAQAEAINARISTLGTAISTAKATLDNTSASKTAINNAVTTLRTAISTALAAYDGLDLAGDDITSFIANNNFEISPTFDGTSLGSGSAPKSNATPTIGSTLLYHAMNVYQVNGWELLTTETSDFARTFTMPYDKTLYVWGNNNVAGQAVASPTNGSSVTTNNNNLLFVEANWCNNAALGVQQIIPLPAGAYRLTFDSYVATTLGNASSLCGVSYGETTDYKWPASTNTWTANEVDFTLDDQTDVTISMGYKKTANVGGGSSAFLFVDNVKLNYLGKAVKDVAIVLPDNGAMTAGTWYYKDVATTGIHAFSATNLGNIIYTTDEDALTSEISATLPQNLSHDSSTRYYFKASSDQTLTICKICDNFGYWFLRTSDYKYLSRGGTYGSQAIADEYGIPVRIAFENNYINFIFVDNWHHLFDADNGNLFGDGDSNVDFAMQPVDGGYYIINKNETAHSTLDQKLYIYSNDGNRVKMSSENATVWVLESVSGDVHKTRMQTIKDAQATTAATSAGITWATTQSALDAYLAKTSTQENVSITGTWDEAQQIKRKSAANNGERTVWSATKSGLSAGLYKLSVKAFERFADNDRTYDLAKGNAGISYVYAGDQKVQLWSVFDFPADASYSEQDVEKGGKHYPDGVTSAQEAFEDGKYVNEVFVWVTGTSLDYGIRIPQSYDGNTGDSNVDNWICYNNFELTYYGNANTIPVTLDATTGFSTFASPYPLDYTQDNLPSGIKAYKATSVDGENIAFEALDQAVPANTGVLLAGEKGETYAIPVVASGTTVTGNIFAVNTSGAEFDGEDGHSYYGLLKGTKEFRPFNPSSVAIPSNKAYLDLTSGGDARLVINLDEVTGINAIDASETEAEGLKDGKYLIGGKIVIVNNGVKYSANGQKLN